MSEVEVRSRTSKSGIFSIRNWGRMSTHSRGDNEWSLVGYIIMSKVKVRSSNLEIRDFRGWEVCSNEYSFESGE